jgi:hypothetical protein
MGPETPHSRRKSEKGDAGGDATYAGGEATGIRARGIGISKKNYM